MGEEDIVFMDHAVDNYMYFISSGSMKYIRKEPVPKTQNMQVGDWLLEAVIWVPWMTQGSLESANESTVCALDARLFVESVKSDTQMFELMCTYAILFADWLSSLPSDRLSDLSPLQETKHFLAKAISQQDP